MNAEQARTWSLEQARVIVGKLSVNARQLILSGKILLPKADALKLRSEFKRHLLGGVFVDPHPWDKSDKDTKVCRWSAQPGKPVVEAVVELVQAPEAKKPEVHRVGSRVFKL